MRTAALVEHEPIARDNSFVRYELLADTNADRQHEPDHPAPQTFYGRLIDIFHVLWIEKHTRHILAGIRMCGTLATLPEDSRVTFNMDRLRENPELADIKTIVAAVGRVHIGGNVWAIVDRSRESVRAPRVDEDYLPELLDYCPLIALASWMIDDAAPDTGFDAGEFFRLIMSSLARLNTLVKPSQDALEGYGLTQCARPSTFRRFVLVARAMMIVLHGRGTPAKFFEFSNPTYRQILDALEPGIPHLVLTTAFAQIHEWFLGNLVHNYRAAWGETRVTMDEYWDEIANARFPMHALEDPEPESLKLARLGVMLGEYLIHYNANLCPKYIYECAVVVHLLIMKMRDNNPLASSPIKYRLDDYITSVLEVFAATNVSLADEFVGNDL
ncbi:hypothetical protein FRC07_000429 [Ceratobasidium sp. 392]|nr:hypothetical protein FRC07_000429 [Ceratobasidium sp. 392]